MSADEYTKKKYILKLLCRKLSITVVVTDQSRVVFCSTKITTTTRTTMRCYTQANQYTNLPLESSHQSEDLLHCLIFLMCLLYRRDAVCWWWCSSVCIELLGIYTKEKQNLKYALPVSLCAASIKA